jgi:7-cyano-7-deazaguanine synthase in queuosine biosynthesis
VVTTSVLATPSEARAVAFGAKGGMPIRLYAVGRPELAGVGHRLPKQFRALGRPIGVREWDFLSIALAVFGADRFVLREDSPDAWTRVIQLHIEVLEPDPWSAVASDLEATLRFLTGDVWQLAFRAGGKERPSQKPKLTDRDCVCLFSGGLDSLIGAMDLVAAGRRPLLVSQATPKEGAVQENLAERIGLDQHRFAGKVTERARRHEQSQRARSILFFAYGILACSDISDELIVPENGLISINPPLTRRRLGSLSTRTTHPFFLSSLQRVLDGVGISVTIRNPYAAMTKGEMLADCQDERIKKLARLSYSCGKGKRKNAQCGTCVPCLIRRASFRAAGIKDRTEYRAADLRLSAKNDDVLAARFAAEQLKKRRVERWAEEAGPLSSDPVLRAAQVDVVRRGLGELASYLKSHKWP